MDVEITESEREKAVEILKQVVFVMDWVREVGKDGIEGRITVDEDQMVKAMKLYAQQDRERTSEAQGEVSPLEGIVSVLERVIESAIPSNWLDPLLTGEDNVIGEAPYTPKDIERLLNAVKKRLKQHVEAEAVEIE